MEDSFELRVKRLFGSQLFQSVPGSSFPSSSWSVVDGEIERREWNRGRGLGSDRSEDPCSSAFADGGCFAKKRSFRRSSTGDYELDFDELDDDIDAEDRRDDDEEEDRGEEDHEVLTEIRSSIGLDPTLDHEDEEDEYDRAALGGDTSERLYMSDVKNHGPHLNYHSIFEDTEDDPYNASHHFQKDPRADHLAAAMLIVEDQKAAENFPVPNYGKADVAIEDTQLKPILKRKELQDDSKPKKRVRFNHVAEADNYLKPTAFDPNSVVFEESADLPDYLRNPSKYTLYTFEDYEDSDLANKKAFEDFHNLHEKLNSEQQQQHQLINEELPKHITFNPRRKALDVVPVYNDSRDARESDLEVARSTGIAAGESISVGVGGIDEESPEETPMDTETPSENERVRSWRRGRQYRAMAASDV